MHRDDAFPTPSCPLLGGTLSSFPQCCASAKMRASLAGTYEAAQERAVVHAITKFASKRQSNHKHKRFLSFFSSRVAPDPSERLDRWARRDSSSNRRGSSTLNNRMSQALPAVMPRLRRASELSHEFESYQYVGEDSRIHLEMRIKGQAARHQLQYDIVSVFLVAIIGIVLAAVATAVLAFTALMHEAKSKLVHQMFWPCEASGSGSCPPQSEPTGAQLAAAYGAYVGMSVSLVLGAALVTVYEPLIAGSGLSRLKAYLNGCHVNHLLTPRTLLAKLVGTCLVVTSGLPLGREGPMVHIGAAIAASISRFNCGPTRRLLELRLPAEQRNWIALGAAAGIAAAFNSPLGGILYSMEEVCSRWSSQLVWRSFLCVVIVVCTQSLLIEASDGWLHSGSLVVGNLAETHVFDVSLLGGPLLWATLLSAIGGVVGACYNLCVFRIARWRMSAMRQPFAQRHRYKFGVAEALVISVCVLSALFFAPLAFGCSPCPVEVGECSAYGNLVNASSSSSGSSSGSIGGSGSGGSGSGGGDHGTLTFLRWNCPAGQYNELASLLHSGQEGLVVHLLARNDGEQQELRLSALLTLLGLYTVLTICSYGIAIPFGNFIPSLTIGASLGRVFGEILLAAGFATPPEVGSYALIGAAAVLGGVTRMTLTLAVLFVEVTDDAQILPATLVALTVARFVGHFISPSFDEGLLDLLSIPFLNESPPRVFEVLTARDVMASPVVTLTELVKVGDIVHALQSCPHNGFPVVRLEKLPARDSVNAERSSGPLADRVALMEKALSFANLSDDERAAAMQRAVAAEHAAEFEAAMAKAASAGYASDVEDRSRAAARGRETDRDELEVRRQVAPRGTRVCCGLILRRQLLVLLHQRVWEAQVKRESLPRKTRELFLNSFHNQTNLENESADLELSAEDLEQLVDLRSFYDASPFFANELMPLQRVFKLFNELGVRSLPVLDGQLRITGIITRKDVLPRTMKKRLSAESYLHWASQFSQQQAKKLAQPSETLADPGAAPPSPPNRSPSWSRDAPLPPTEDAVRPGRQARPHRLSSSESIRSAASQRSWISSVASGAGVGVGGSGSLERRPRRSSTAGPASMHNLRNMSAHLMPEYLRANRSPSMDGNGAHVASRRDSAWSQLSGSVSNNGSDSATRDLWTRVASRRSNAAMLDLLADTGTLIIDSKTASQLRRGRHSAEGGVRSDDSESDSNTPHASFAAPRRGSAPAATRFGLASMRRRGSGSSDEPPPSTPAAAAGPASVPVQPPSPDVQQ